jgi:hypothetical protein
MIAAAGVEQPVVRIARLCRRIEFGGSHRVSEVCDHVSLTQELAPGSGKRAGPGVGGVPFGDDVVVGHILCREPWRDEVGRLWIARTAFGVDGVEQAVPRELRMEREPNESTLQAVIDSERKQLAQIGIHLWLGVGADQIEEAALIVDEAAAVGEIAHELNARPSRGRHILIGRAYPARIRKAHDIFDLDLQSTFGDRGGNRIGRDLPRDRVPGADRQQERDDEPDCIPHSRPPKPQQ